jgi:nucleoside-diphosphate-sugar epimerase
MKIAITGADGRIGRVLKEHWRKTHEIIAVGNGHDLRERGAWETHLAEADTIVHLAAVLSNVEDFETLRENIEITLNVVRAAGGTQRIIYASSIWVLHEQTSLGPRGNFYSASKNAGEAIVGGWSDIHQRPAVSLRIGKFGDPAPIEHEMLRVDEATLQWWFDKALAYDEPLHAAWLVIGRSNHLIG